MDTSIEERVFFRLETVGFGALSVAEKTYWLIWTLEAVANNGGIDTFLEDHADIAEAAAEALERIGANAMCGLVREGIHAYELNDNSKLEDVNQQFCNYPDDVGALLENYVSLNAQDFLGPSTKKVLWEEAKRSGMDTSPRFVTKQIDFEQEAISDKPYSSRNCPKCEQPVPDYRQTCKKCGYPLGRHQPIDNS